MRSTVCKLNHRHCLALLTSSNAVLFCAEPCTDRTVDHFGAPIPRLHVLEQTPRGSLASPCNKQQWDLTSKTGPVSRPVPLARCMHLRLAMSPARAAGDNLTREDRSENRQATAIDQPAAGHYPARRGKPKVRRRHSRSPCRSKRLAGVISVVGSSCKHMYGCGPPLRCPRTPRWACLSQYRASRLSASCRRLHHPAGSRQRGRTRLINTYTDPPHYHRLSPPHRTPTGNGLTPLADASKPGQD